MIRLLVCFKKGRSGSLLGFIKILRSYFTYVAQQVARVLHMELQPFTSIEERLSNWMVNTL